MPRRKKTSQIPTWFAIGGGILLLIAVILVATKNAPATVALPVASSGQEVPYPGIARVSLADAETALDSGTAVFLDVRGADVYAMSHIPGALSIPLAEIEMRLNELDPAQWIITYCT